MPETYTVVRSAHLAAPPQAVFTQLVDLRKWEAWSPWDALDPHQERTYSGADSGVGAKFVWKGNKKVGQGTMEILEAEEPRLVTIELRFIKPFKSTAETRLEVQAEGDGSLVTWTMEGANTLMTKVMGIFKSMDAMIGPDFEKGLASLKATVEGGSG